MGASRSTVAFGSSLVWKTGQRALATAAVSFFSADDFIGER